MEPKLTGTGRLRLGALDVTFTLGEGEPLVTAEQLRAYRDKLLDELNRLNTEIKRLEG